MQNAHEGDICLTGERAADFEYTNKKQVQTQILTQIQTEIQKQIQTPIQKQLETQQQIQIQKNSQKHEMHKKMIFAGRKK